MPIFFSYRFPGFRIRSSSAVKRWIVNVFQSEKKSLRQLSIIFCSDRELLKINKEFLNHNYLTDIVTFQYNQKNAPVEGEIFISVNRVRDNAKKFETKSTDELYRVMIHGVLHLCGYKDKTLKEKSVIRNQENHYLQKRNF